MEAFSQRSGSEGFYTWNIFISGYTVDKNINGAPKIQNYYEFIMLSNYLFFQYCNCNIRLFSIAPCNYCSLSLINFWSNFFASFLHFPFIVIALPTIAISIVDALSSLWPGSEGFYTWNIFISGYTVSKNIIGAPKISK